MAGSLSFQLEWGLGGLNMSCRTWFHLSLDVLLSIACSIRRFLSKWSQWNTRMLSRFYGDNPLLNLELAIWPGGSLGVKWALANTQVIRPYHLLHPPTNQPHFHLLLGRIVGCWVGWLLLGLGHGWWWQSLLLLLDLLLMSTRNDSTLRFGYGSVINRGGLPGGWR